MPAGTIGVAGLGLIGGSVALRLADAGVSVIGLDPSPQAAEQAAAAGISVVSHLATLAGQAQLVFVAAPPARAPEVVAELLAADPHVLVCDLASTKARIAAAVAELAGPDAARYLPVHPLMGSDRGGFAAASPALLRGALWAVCPPVIPGAEANSGPLVRLSEALEHFDARMLICTPEEHDAAVARTSHAPHLIAGAAAAALSREHETGLPLAAALSGGGFRDFTRIARSDHSLWGQVLAQNSTAVREAIDALIGELEMVRGALEDPQSHALADLWQHGHTTLEAVDRLRWTLPTWERKLIAWPGWAELLELGRAGRTVRALSAADDGNALWLDVAQAEPAGADAPQR